MRQAPKTFLLVEAVADENDVLYLVADPRVPSRRVGVKFKNPRPESPEHFAEHFEKHPHLVDASNILHLAHYRAAETAGTLKILGQCQAQNQDEAMTKITASMKE